MTYYETMLDDITIAITGHSKGIGHAITKIHENCIGFSRSNGYDIDNIDDRRKIIDQSQDCDVFINNAYSKLSQVDLLYEMFEEWKDQQKHIVNIGSVSSDGIKRHVWKYSVYKAALDKACEQLSNQKSECDISLVKFGYVGTERILSRENPPTAYIDVNDAADAVINVIRTSRKYQTTSITMVPK